MNAAAVEVMKELPDLCIAYGVSDEFRYGYCQRFQKISYSKTQLLSSFVFHPSCQLFERRSA